MVLRYSLAICLVLSLSGCTSDRQYALHSLWPFGNPNAPVASSETAQRALGRSPVVAPIVPQAGDVWPGPVQPMPTLSQIQKNSNLPLGQAYTPSLPSPYPPGQGPDQNGQGSDGLNDGSLYSTQPGSVPQVVPAVPGDAR